MTVTVAAALVSARRRLEAAGIESSAREARILLAHALEEAPARLVGWPERIIESEPLRSFEALVDRRLRREPVAYLVGSKEFWGLAFGVDAATLIPRPDTETLVAAALEAWPSGRSPVRVLDIGTGSGCVLVSLLHEWPTALGLGVDPSAAALAVARANAVRLGVGERAAWRQGLPEAGDADVHDLVVANLPYIPSADIEALDPDVRDYEPRSALDGGADGLAVIRIVAAELPRLLAPGGLALFEVGIGQAAEVQRIFRSLSDLAPTRSWADLAGIERVVGVRRRGG